MNEEALDESPETTDAAENTEVSENQNDNRETQSEESGNQEPTGDTQADIEEAKKYGFKDPAEYDGNPEYQVSAKDYLARRQKGGIIKEKDETINNLRLQMAETTKAVKSMASFHERQLERTKADAEEAARSKYIKSVDEDGASGAEALTVYEQEKAKINTQYTPPKEEVATQEDPEIAKFNQENPWLYDNVVMKGAANAINADIANKYPAMPLSQRFAMVKKQIVENFPDKFENPKKKIQSIEGGGTIHGGAVRKKDTLASLGFSAADKMDVQKAINAGEFKDESAFIKYYNGGR